jgi:DNA-binding Lrp family transcriptional regulator
MKVIMLIVVEPEKLENVCKSLSKINGITKVYEITGEFDIFIEIEVDSMEIFRNTLKNKILKIPGIRMTQSSVVLGEWK